MLVWAVLEREWKAVYPEFATGSMLVNYWYMYDYTDTTSGDELGTAGNVIIITTGL